MVHVHRARSAGCSWAGVMGAAAVSRGTTAVKGRMIGCLCASVMTLPVAVRAQTRELEQYGSGSPEGKLMLYYSSTVAFSPLGVPFGVRYAPSTTTVAGGSSRFELSVEVSYLPPLSAEQRTAGSDKPEATNLAPVFVRPRVGARLPGGFGVELSWIPPLRVFDVKANLFAGALSRSFALPKDVYLVPRVSFLTGRVEGPITCNSETAAEGSADLATYYALVCYGNDSQDYFEPRHISGELMIARTSGSGRWQSYLTAGARGERTQFDVGVIRTDGSRDPDQPILEVRTTRAYGAVGTSWFGVSRTRLAAELYYAPGSVLTGRVLAGVRLW